MMVDLRVTFDGRDNRRVYFSLPLSVEMPEAEEKYGARLQV